MTVKKMSSVESIIHQLNEQLQIIRSSVEHLAMVLDLSNENTVFLDNVVAAVDNITKNIVQIKTSDIKQYNKKTKINYNDLSKKLGSSILIIDDEKDIVEIYKYNLEILGFKVFCANSFLDGVSILDEESIDVVILDIMLPDAYGFDCIDVILDKNKNIKIVVTTGKLDELEQNLEYLKDKCVILTKPFSTRALLAAIL